LDKLQNVNKIYQSSLRDQKYMRNTQTLSDEVEEKEWQYLDVNQQSVETLCGKSKGPCRHKETWWWSDEVAKAVKDKKLLYGRWWKERSKESRQKYKEGEWL